MVGHARARERNYHVVLARAVRWIDYDRKMRDAPNRGNRREVEGVARVLCKGPHAALA